MPAKRLRRRSLRWETKRRFEALEDRIALSVDYDIESLDARSIQGTTGTKPQSKVWFYDDTWWSVLANSSGTWVWRLDDDTWTTVLNLTSGEFRADVRSLGNVAHVLLEGGTASKLASIEYVPGSGGSPGTYVPWSARPAVTNVSLSSGITSATLDVDSTGRMWVASNSSSAIEMRYSDSPYTSFSAPITVAAGVSSGDIGTVLAMPGNRIAAFWSNQVTERWGFRIHNDADAPTQWLADEVPASQSALDVGGGMADDHMNVKVASDGTVYAAVKTSYDSSSQTLIGLLVRHPDGTWDDLYYVDNTGSRPTLALSETHNSLLVIYATSAMSYRESALWPISFGPRETLLSSGNNPSNTKDNFTNEVIVIASGKTARATPIGPPNEPPVASGETYATGEDEPLAVAAGGVLANDGDPENSPLTAVLATNASHGSVALASDGSFIYTPAANYNGPDSFAYQAYDGQLLSNLATVSLEVAAVPDLPVALDDSYTAPLGQTLAVDAAAGVLANDEDDDGDALTAAVVDWPLHGVLTLDPDGSFTYEPDGTYGGTDSFTYRAQDLVGPSNLATVTLVSNHAPVLDPAGAMSLEAIVENDVTSPGTTVSGLIASAGGDRITDSDQGALEGIAVTAADTQNGVWQFSLDGNTWTNLGTPSESAARLLPADGAARLRFVPNLNYTGTVADGLTFRAWDQTSGAAGDVADASVGGGLAAFSAASESASITVIPAALYYYMSTTGGVTLKGSDGVSLPVVDSDIALLTIPPSGPYGYSMFFDGSDVGLSGSAEDVDAFDFLPDGRIVLSTLGSYSVSASYAAPGSGSGANLSGGGEDLLVFTPSATGADTAGSWALYFDGSDVGLSGSAETLDAVAVLENGNLLISTAGSLSALGVAGTDEDLFEFIPASLGDVTSGTLSQYFDGSDVGLADTSDEDIDGLFVEAMGGELPRLLLTTRGNFSVPGGIAGADEDLLQFTPSALGANTSGTYGPGLVLDGSQYGLSSADLDGVSVGLAPGGGGGAGGGAAASLSLDAAAVDAVLVDLTSPARRRTLLRRA